MVKRLFLKWSQNLHINITILINYEVKYFSLNEVLVVSGWRCGVIQLKFLRWRLWDSRERKRDTASHILVRRKTFAICYHHRRDSITWTIHHTNTALYSLQKWSYGTTMKDAKYRGKALFFYDISIVIKYGSFDTYHRSYYFRSHEKRSVVSSSYRVDRKGRISITISIPTRSGIHKLFRVLWTFLTLAQDCCVIFSNL